MSISVTGCSTWIRQLISMKYALPAVDEELEGADVLVAGGDDGANRRSAGRRGRGGQRRRRRLLEDLLVPALDRAVALAQVDALAIPVDRDLDLDVAVVVEPLLEVQRVVAERGARLGTADRDRRSSSRGVRTMRMPLPPPPADGLMSTG